MTLFLVVSEIRGGVSKVYAKWTAAKPKAAPTTNVRLAALIQTNSAVIGSRWWTMQAFGVQRTDRTTLPSV